MHAEVVTLPSSAFRTKHVTRIDKITVSAERNRQMNGLLGTDKLAKLGIVVPRQDIGSLRDESKI